MFRTWSANEMDICARAQKWDGTYLSFSLTQSGWVCWLGSACIAISFKFNGVLFNLYAISFYYYGFRIIIIMACENRRSQHSAVVSGGPLEKKKKTFSAQIHSLNFFEFFKNFMILKRSFLARKFFRAHYHTPSVMDGDADVNANCIWKTENENEWGWNFFWKSRRFFVPHFN